MSVRVYKTDAILITDYQSMAELVKWASSEIAEGLVGKKVIVVESGWGFSVKKPTPHQQSIVNLFYTLVAQSSKWGLDFVFILNNPEYLDPRLRMYVERVETLGGIVRG